MQNGALDEERDLILDPLTVEEIRRLADRAGGVERLLSKKSPKYKEYEGRVTGPDDWIRFMAEEPRLLKRPILVNGGQVLVGFDPTAWSQLTAGPA